MMTPRERIAAAMNHQIPDRVPYWCQLSGGHIWMNTLPVGQSRPETIEQHVACECALTKRYGFDGMLMYYPGKHLKGEPLDLQQSYVVLQNYPPFETADPAKWIYQHPRATPEEMYASLLAREILGEEIHIGGWTTDAFSLAVNWCGGLQAGMLALVDDPSRFLALIDYFCQEAIDWAFDQIRVGGMESIHISSPYAGSSLISRRMYEKFVLPSLKRLAAAIKTTPAFSYLHTCGFLGDRLELLAESGVDGIECMDPPPLGDVELGDAKCRIGNRVFLKGNMDSVNILLRGSDADVDRTVRACLDAGMPGGGYILSTACSTAPDVRPERMLHIRDLVEKYGYY
jgi:uroporphyrinogen decarboxylase